ncbi:MAG TPA: membrane dipeptidase [Tepidisphaeraceae bacterium]|nr:membrane dipeptidase [Tepidisphaeraceae bacterium]
MNFVDGHLDLSTNAVLDGRDVTQPARDQPIVANMIATVGLPDLRAGHVKLIFATIFCQPKTTISDGYTDSDGAHAQAIAQLDWYDKQFDVGQLRRFGSIDPGEDSPSIETILLLEGADAIRSLDDVTLLKQRGVRIVGLAWQGTRYAGGSGAPGPITREGRTLVKELDRQNILHDASHLAEQSFWDLVELSDRPIIASHSNCRSIVGEDPRGRHLTDAMIRAIIERDGVIGINFFDLFLLPSNEYGKRRATLDDVVAHIKHVCDLAGSCRHVAIGTDMDGGLGREQIPLEIETSADFPKVFEKLIDSGFSHDDALQIVDGNWRRIAANIPKYAS